MAKTEDEKITEFRDGIFALRTRRFGTVAEEMIKKLYNLGKADNLAYDKKDPKTNAKVEIKFSTVMKENEENITGENIIEQCTKANLANRALNSDEVSKYKFDCNIQQVKPKEFDELYYGLFFADCIEIFKMNKDDVTSCHGYSDKQHRGNEGEGQFHINQDNIEYHRENHKVKDLSYKEFYDLLNKKEQS